MNTIKLIGTVLDKPEYSHEVLGEKFYKFMLETKRRSGYADILICVASELLVSVIEVNSRVAIDGEIRTRNKNDDNGKRHLHIEVFCNEIVHSECTYDLNETNIVGFLCRKPTLRETPLGREISETMVASNRAKVHRADYIPLITWSRNAQRMSKLDVGEKVNVSGRLQSRIYKKIIENGLEELKTAYEVSVVSFFKESEE